MALGLVFEEDFLSLICGYSPQSVKRLKEKQPLYDELKCEWDMHYADALVMSLGEFNAHVGRRIDVFHGVHGGCGVGQRNLEGGMLLEFHLGNDYVCQIHGLRGRKRGW